ncbi:MAG: PLP-dependent aminotransferase family protein [Clostridiales bacterium]|nr:PLP-dependent aminotransferase family protein [Clostridiales bacterium]
MSDLTPSLDPGSPLPLYEQLYRSISRDIIMGRIQGGTRLPSRRALSRHLGISEQTISNAYALLKAEGFISAKARSGLFVERMLPLTEAPVHPAPHKEKDEALIRFDLLPQSTDISLFPRKLWARLMREALLDEPDLMKRGDPRGEHSLRAALCAFLYQFRGVQTTFEQMVIASGVDQLLLAICALFNRPLRIACEDPGYTEAARVIRRAGHTPVPLPLDEHGIRIDTLMKEDVDLVYITPAHQFPTGISMPASRRAELLHWAQERTGRYLIEDDYDSEFRYATRPLPALQSLDATGKVIYLSTFSRSLAPGLRIAYMALPKELSEAYTKTGLRSGETVTRFEQHTMARFIQEGHYTRHLRRAGNRYQKRCEQLCALLSQIPGSFLSGQEAGLHFLFGIKGRTEKDLLQKAADRHIPLQGLQGFCQDVHLMPALVMGFGGLEDEQVEEAVALLRMAWSV